MLRCDVPHFSIFGEIYFSVIEKGAVKAWKKHKVQAQNFACPSGRIRIVAYDARQASPTFNKLETFILGLPDHYQLLHIPPGICYGFAALDKAPALLANCADLPHSPEEAENIPADSSLVPYSWTGPEC
jgi:dTDP-4-dehydrorhamnose 3,5-epimerase